MARAQPGQGGASRGGVAWAVIDKVLGGLLLTMLVIPAHPAHVHLLAGRLRTLDLRELRAMTLETPAVALGRLLRDSEPCLTVVGRGGVVVGMFGAVSSLSNSGEAWLLGADELVASPRLLARLTLEWIPRLHQKYHCLWCNVDSRNEVHIRWLCWAGFNRTGTLESHGVEGRRFYCYARFASTPLGRW